MSKQRAEQIIVISLIVMLASTVGGSLVEQKAKGSTKEKEKYFGRKIIGGFFAILLTALLAEVAAAPAAYMSVGMSSYAFFHYGLPAINKNSKPVKMKKSNFVPGPEIPTEPLLETFGGTFI
jgi:uncharacterized membrane protein AbrB (regulator of aidB expression)